MNIPLLPSTPNVQLKKKLTYAGIVEVRNSSTQEVDAVGLWAWGHNYQKYLLITRSPKENSGFH